ncbi:MAG: TonB family protein [Cyanobacteria bacterium SZAS-4]|nr:TonB family protein [Cyanobacteria bacterium SZAS-4]
MKVRSALIVSIAFGSALTVLNLFSCARVVQAADSHTESATVEKAKSPDMTAYMESVKQRIQRVWRSPDVKSNCKVSVLFTIDKNGGLVSSAVKTSSGIASVDQVALQTVKKSAPFSKLPDGAGKFSVDYTFQCGPRNSADAYIFNGVPIKDQEYKMSSGGATLRNLNTDSPAERKLHERAAAFENKAESLETRLSALQGSATPDDTKISAVSLELANVFKELQKYDKAEPLYKSAIALGEKLENQTFLSNALFDFANLYYVMGKYADAEPLYERSLSVRSKIENLPVNKQALTEYAKTLYKMNKFSKADEIYKQLR